PRPAPGRRPRALLAPGRAGPPLVSVAARQDVPQRQREDSQVEPERPVVDVVEIVLYPLLEVAVPAQVIHLRPARDAGPDEVLLHVARDALPELADELGSFGAGADERHLTPEDVEQLRQLVEAVAAEERAERCRASLVVARPHGAGLRFDALRH